MNQGDWNRQAAKLIKAELARAGVGYEGLAELLRTIGVDESYKGLASKINRGTFSFNLLHALKRLWTIGGNRE